MLRKLVTLQVSAFAAVERLSSENAILSVSDHHGELNSTQRLQYIVY
jgi:hypothetical protein